MGLILQFVISYLCFVEIIDSKLMRIQPNDKLFSYTIDPTVTPFTEYMTVSNFHFEQIDDEKVEVSGYGLFTKSVDPRMPLQFDLKTKHFENSIWTDALFRLTLPSICQEFINPQRFWYNITKLWTKNCPPQKGEKWEVENQIIDMKIYFPPSIPSGSWQTFVLLYQMGSNTKFGIMFEAELTEIAGTIS